MSDVRELALSQLGFREIALRRAPGCAAPSVTVSSFMLSILAD
jgi:hypothetical protein